MAEHFTDDAVHYYTRRDPQHGARTIAENAIAGREHIEGRWKLEHAVEKAAICFCVCVWPDIPIFPSKEAI